VRVRKVEISSIMRCIFASLQWGLTREGEEGGPKASVEGFVVCRFNGASPVRVRKAVNLLSIVRSLIFASMGPHP